MSVYLTEEEQIEAIKKWWKRYGNYILTILLIFVLGFLATKWWQKHRLTKMTYASNQFQQLMLATSNNDKSLKASITDDLKKKFPDTVYAVNASLLKAQTLVENKKLNQAVDELNWAISHAKDNVFKQLAKLRLARVYLQTNQFELALATLSEFEKGPYSHLALELKGDVYWQKGERQKAHDSYQKALAMVPDSKENAYLNYKISMTDDAHS